MKHRRLIVLPVAAIFLALSGWAITRLIGSVRASEIYYIDYDRGVDTNAGTSVPSSWKHAPGDPAASGKPAMIKLKPGDKVIFAANVRYRGNIVVSASGGKSNPIVFEGAKEGGAIIDGSDPVRSRKCPDSQSCGGARNWHELTLIEGDKAFDENSVFFTQAEMMRIAQEPDPADDFYRNETDTMIVASSQDLQRGELALPKASSDINSNAELLLWVRPNIVKRAAISSIDGDHIRFNPSGLDFYKDRPGKFALVNHVSLIDQMGEYAILPGSRSAVAMLPPLSRVSVGSGRQGVDLKGNSGLVIRNLIFEHMADNGKMFGGIGIWNNRPGSSDVRIADNIFRNFIMPAGLGAFHLRGISRLRIENNVIDGISMGSGMRIMGPAQDILIQNNVIRRIGRTGIMLMNVSGALVRRNTISDVRGVHGNGISVYLDNHDVRVVANTIVDAKQAATFRGAAARATGPNNLLFANNVLLSTPGALGALIGWGGNTQGVAITNNIMSGGRFGLRLRDVDSGMNIVGNLGTKMVISYRQPRDWIIRDNKWVELSRDDMKLLSVSEKGGGRLPSNSRLCAILAIRDPSMQARVPVEDQRQLGSMLSCP